MFAIGQYVVCGNKGVCAVENITTLDISGVDKKRKYYILKPIYQTGSTLYVPVDAPGEMRCVMNRQEAEKLVGSIPEIPLLTITNDKLTEQVYRECMKRGSCVEWVRLLKTIHVRKQKRLLAGRKVTALDTKYFQMAEQSLYGELAVALELSRDAVGKYIAGEIRGSARGLYG